MIYSKKQIAVVVAFVVLVFVCLILILLLVVPGVNSKDDDDVAEICIAKECITLTEQNKMVQTVSSSVCIPRSCISMADFQEHGKLCIWERCLHDEKHKNGTHRKLCMSKTCLTTTLKTEKLVDSKSCLTRDCGSIATAISDWMSFDVEPCDDFYEYACGGIKKKYSREPWKSSSKKLAEDKTSLKIREILEDQQEKEESDALSKAKMVYQSCLDSAQKQEKSNENLKNYFSKNKIGTWPMLELKWKDCIDIEQRMAYLHAFGVDSFFRLETEFKGINNTLTGSMYFADPLIDGICDGVFTDEDGNLTDFAADVTKDYYNLMTRVLELFDAPDNFTEEDIEDIFRFDYKFCNATKPSRHFPNAYHRSNQTLRDLISIAPLINWSRWHNLLFKLLGLNHKFDKTQIFIYHLDKSISAFQEVISSTSPRVLANYLSWKFSLYHLGFLSAPFVQVVQDYYSNLGRNFKFDIRSGLPLWKRCVQFVKSQMSIALVPSYLNKVVTPALQREVNIIALDIRKVFNETLKNSSRFVMSEIKKGMKKIQSLKFRLLYPDESEFFYNEYYSKIVKLSSNSFLNNAMALQKFQLKKLFEGIQRNVNISNDEYVIMLYDPFLASSWSDFRRNLTMLSFGALTNSDIDVKHSRYLNFGSFGSLYAAEVARGFNFRNFNPEISVEGPVRNWTTWPYYVALFGEKRYECFKTFYLSNRGKPHDMTMFRFVGNMMADSQGLSLSFKAYKKQLEIYGKESILPTLDLSNEQVFFIRYAQTFCSAESESEFTDKVQVNGAVSNIDDFSDSFLCPDGKKMNPTNKCLSL